MREETEIRDGEKDGIGMEGAVVDRDGKKKTYLTKHAFYPGY